VNEFSDPAYLRKVPKPLFAAFSLSDTLSQYFCGEAAADLPPIFEAVRDRLCRAVDSNRDTFNPCVDGALR